ncbi:hypothetical protein OWV82_020288 [Melia azedarach]|uniref:Uncharacterized protein n=1 Tax=Melia azedarach TaxID=155640 RepID=A0ACC1X5D6_MELAZ|nr:hypothetical protein OWV82_020288 [Melia azedarach]
MGIAWGMTIWMAKMVLMALRGWVSSCLTVADEAIKGKTWRSGKGERNMDCEDPEPSLISVKSCYLQIGNWFSGSESRVLSVLSFVLFFFLLDHGNLYSYPL